MSLTITKRDGSKEVFNADQINRSIERACLGLSNPIAMVTQIATDTRFTLYDGITTDELDQATINAAIQNIKEDIEYDRVATRLMLKTVYRRVVGEYDKDDGDSLKSAHKKAFTPYIKEGIAENRLDPRMGELFDLDKISSALEPSRDELFQYAGLDGLLNRYSIKNGGQEAIETPQYFFMRVAMGLAYNEADPTDWAIRFYEKMSKMEYIAGGSCNLGAGTTKPALSNCFLVEMQDDMEHIAKSVADVMLLSKASGGIGLSLTKPRVAGSPLLSGSGGASTGPTPFAKIIDTAIRAIQRGGKKKGALCFYMETWHMDFPEFIDWKHNAGDDYMRMRTANTASYITDEFMKRAERGDTWYLFDPKETPDLVDLYGEEFSVRYNEYVALAEAGKMRAFKKMPAQELFRRMIVALQTTSHPWLAWKDSTNLRALNNNTGVIPGSNLCMEICLPHNRENVAVCNLASINLSAHVINKEVNWQKLEETTRMAVRFLDNLIDINKLPLPEARKSDQENRAMGLGVMGLADVFERLGLAYDSEHAYNFADRVFEFVSYIAIDESANLARVRGPYSNFAGSRWSKGMVPIDTLQILEEGRGRMLTVDKTSHHKGLDWDILRAKVKEGMRNATIMAIAPNANIGLLAGTVPGMDARFSQVFARNKISGKYMDINHNLVKDLKNMGLWESVKGDIIELQGDISSITAIPEHIRNVYKTSFTNSPYAYVEVAARAQKWIDQGISRNIYLETRDVDETMRLYQTAWDKGLKSTYYLHMKPRHTAEQSTVSVNKSQTMGKAGFGAVKMTKPAEASPAPFAAPLQKNFVIPETEPVVAVKSVEMDFAKPAPQAVTAPVAVPAPAMSERTVVQEAAAIMSEDVKVEATAVAMPEPAKAVRKGFMSLEDLKEKVPASAPVAVLEKQPALKMEKEKPFVCPIDPAERAQCDSCQ